MLLINKITTAIDGVARLARGVDWIMKLSPELAGDQRPAQDPTNSKLSHDRDLGASGKMESGTIVEALPRARAYMVEPEAGSMLLDCCLAMRSAATPIGVYDASTLVVGTHVKYMRIPETTSGVILGIEPMYCTDPAKSYGDVISMGSNTSLRTESGFSQPFQLGGSTESGHSLSGGITDWSGRTPWDSLEVGEFNKTSELGLMIHLDSYMAFLRADEYTGVWCYYWDGLTRVAGQNFQRWAGPTELEAYDDEGENAWYHGIGTYPWEHQGMLVSPTSDVTFQFSAQETQETYPYYSRIEPLNDDLQPFHRFRTYSGYLGQSQKKLTCAPRLYVEGGPDADTEHLYSDCYYQGVGLHDQQIMLSGHWAVRNALGIHIAKRPIIPVPKRCEIVTSDDGDNHTNYKASSYYGSGASHKVQPTPTADLSVGLDEMALYRANTVMDLHSHLFNWEGQHVFYYHENDYFLPDESEYEPVYTNQEVPAWGALDATDAWYLDVADYDDVTIDHRTGGAAKVYRNTSYISLYDEGGLSIGDGFGSEIKMAGGCIFLECPGDVFLAPGRNVIAWGGRDICLRAWNSVDISCNKNDIRLKAERNIHMLAANEGGSYGVCIESGGTSAAKYDWTEIGEEVESTGIVLKAKYTEIVGLAKNIYLRTRLEGCLGKAEGSDAAGSQPKDGDITLDAKGKGDIVTRSEFVKHWVKCAVMHAFPDKPGINQVNFFTEDGATMCGDVYTDGDLLSYGSHVARNDFVSATGHFYSDEGGFVAKSTLTGTAEAAINQGHAYEATLRTWSTGQWNIDLQTMWYSAGRPGNCGIIKSIWVSMRTMVDYVSDAFTMWEARWAQMARENGPTSAPATWSEWEVESNDDDWPTMPFPGYERLYEDSDVYKYTTNKLYSTTDGWSEDRGPLYEANVTLNAPTETNLDGVYPVIGRA